MLFFISQKAYSVEYKYDALGRLSSVLYDDGKLVEYRYDAAGNRNTVLVNGNENGGNKSPVAKNDSASAVTWTPILISPLKNDSDPDGDALVISALGTGVGSCSIVSNKTQISCFFNYQLGTHKRTYSISDGKGGVSSATVTISVSAGRRR